jgi:plastocyanin
MRRTLTGRRMRADHNQIAMPEPRACKLALSALLTITTALAVGCARTQHVGSDRTLRLAVTEYRFNPQKASVTAGPLTIVVHNFGRLTHNLVLSRTGQPEISTKPIPPGESAEVSLTLTPGTYQMFSTILSDQAVGETGTLTVVR